MNNKNHLLIVKNLFVFMGGKYVLNNFNLKFNKGNFLCIIGMSGSGKTTFLNTLLDIIDYQGGEIYLDGCNIKDIPLYNRGICFLDAKSMMFKNLTVINNILFGVRGLDNFYNVPYKILKKVLFVANKLGISHILNNNIENISSGEKHRVGIARTFISKYKLYIIDEPFVHLDDYNKQRVIDFIKYIKFINNLSIIMVSHSYDSVIDVGTHVCVINKGSIIQCGSPISIMNFPAIHIAKFLKYYNILTGILLSFYNNCLNIITLNGMFAMFYLNKNIFINQKDLKIGNIVYIIIKLDNVFFNDYEYNIIANNNLKTLCVYNKFNCKVKKFVEYLTHINVYLYIEEFGNVIASINYYQYKLYFLKQIKNNYVYFYINSVFFK